MRTFSLYLSLTIYLFVYVFTGLFNQAFADADFDTSYKITYDVGSNGLTHATFKGILSNKISKTYATSYKINLNFKNVSNIKAFDTAGLIKVITKKSATGYDLQLPFNVKVVGLDKKLPFTLSFDTTDVAKEEGSIWEVNVPALADQKFFSDLQIKVSVPPTFGPASIIKPEQATQDLNFTKEELGASGVSVLFGTGQTYSYHLSYHIKNSNLFPIQTTIALPPTTNYQQVILSSLDPRPENVVIDTDGNWIATYYLLPSEKKDVTANGKVILSVQPIKQALSEEDKKSYLKPQTYWEVTNPNIIAQANKLQTPEAIYQYVVRTLHYDFNRINKQQPRLGAQSVLNDPRSAVCLEFTDLFIALSRAAGIPAREVDGFAYTQNAKERPVGLVTDILHAWPEYYDETRKTWIMVDPTWGNTTNGIDYFHKLDFDHVAFVIKGLDSVYPIPAGGYKTPNDAGKKDVNVQFTSSTTLPPEKLSFSPVTATKYFSGFPITGDIQIKNTGSILTYPENIVITSSDLTPGNQKILLSAVPPYGTIKKSFSFVLVPFLTNRTYPFTIQLANTSLTGYIVAASFFLTKEILAGGIICAIFIIIIFIITRKARRVHVPR